eukprot:EG_transcript_13188
MRIAFLTMEFTNAFSGNGTASQSFVRSLLARGHHLCVLCCCPAGQDDDLDRWRETHGGKFVGASVPVSTWRRIDWRSSWEEFGAGVADSDAVGLVRTFQPTLVMGVDWSSMGAYRALLASGVSQDIPFVYFCFRVFHRNTGVGAEEEQFYRRWEGEAVAATWHRRCLCLCRADRAALRALCAADPAILLPALREEVRLLAAAAPADPRPRELLLCCVRLSVEKNTMAFVEVVALLGEDFLRTHRLVPCLVGAEGDAQYASEVRQRLRDACPGAIQLGLVDAAQLCDLFRRAVLNFHPALNEAYGMTIVEAAALGTASIIDHGGGIGVTDLLLEKDANPEVFSVDMRSPLAVALYVKDLLGTEAGRQRLEGVSARARQRALQHTEVECGVLLDEFLLQHSTDPDPPDSECFPRDARKGRL